MHATGCYYRDLLRDELDRRTRKNPRYSLRAFARSLEIDATALWRVLTGRRHLTQKSASQLADKLGCDAEGRRMFLASVAREREQEKLKDVDGATAAAARDPILNLAAEQFAVIAEWHHYAILELTYVDGCKDDPDWLARTLNITPAEARAALDRLLKIGLLEEKDGRLIKTQCHIHAVDPKITNDALKLHQRQLLTKAGASLADDDPERRAFTTMILPADPIRLATARRMMEEFAWHLCRHLSDGQRTDVYALNVALFPLTTPETES